ncbi:MAG: hypothetical protein A2172_01775 [Candidatus Woykebacteria bacterium RBG_13_40_15]|uniref:Uncharacterized protein n=1 Tax=Candidatus Woykebacteria bacterium RBG_13_40_15 TaxID=1802593 RepID=A0A1G1WA64_9BACT|nr:MAG: hypothetical protein A2172_01775 [Candidatus Woykebacteria bacterium RBG_13_40_15]
MQRRIPMNITREGKVSLRMAGFGILGLVIVTVLAAFLSKGDQLTQMMTPGFTETVLQTEPGQDGTFFYEGTVTDRESGKPIPGAEVVVLRYYQPPSLSVMAQIPGRTPYLVADAASIGESQVEVVKADENGYWRVDGNKYEQVVLTSHVDGYHDQNTRIFLTDASRRVDLAPIPGNLPGPPAKGQNVVQAGFRNEQSGENLTALDDLKERVVAGLQCQGIDVTVDDITDIDDITLNGTVKTNILLRSDDCSSIEARDRTYLDTPAKSVETTKGTFILVDNCVNLAIPSVPVPTPTPGPTLTPTPKPTVTPTPEVPRVRIRGKKVELIGTHEVVPSERFTFEIEGWGTARTDDDGDFQFVLNLFGGNNDQERSVEICEERKGGWEVVYPSGGCKSFTVERGDTFVDAGKWKNRSVKDETETPLPTPTPCTPGPTPTNTPPPPTATPTPCLSCNVTIIGPHRVDNTDTHARMQASVQWDGPPPSWSRQVKWYLDGEFIGGGDQVEFMATLNVNHTLTVKVWSGDQVICQDTATFSEGSIPPDGDDPGTNPLPTETPIPAPQPTSDPDDGYGGPV